ncbi:hypothetical protein OQZ33_17080 [Pedobacter sp. MC2016-05]|uniref:DUF6908 domain-containing protein n=1 Tax=Pedobacter sp. MC2016-05 TaxID=2994474 RepID=UPI0022451F5F|nr:hypothetical protein [Pedobacter sp. MC2016-05]MCX2476050.1 hypothetical protein [Pedobacter sp. MC2016-05]
MPLSIENMGGNFPTVWGNGHFYSLCHYCEQNGDLMQDPEMCFLVVDERKSADDYENLRVVPCSFQNATAECYEESISFMSERVSLYLPRLHEQHLEFAKIWLNNIVAQVFLNIQGGQDEA